MLPDSAKLKRDLSARLRRFLEIRMLHHLGPLAESPRVRFFEGERRAVVRRSGQQEPVEPFEISSTMTFQNDELPTLSLENLLEKLDLAAQDMAAQVARHSYEVISKAAESVGNMVDAKQMRVSAEMILEGLSKMYIAFDESGRPQMPSIHCHPDLEKAILLATEELERSPALRQQLIELLILKKEEWRVREASRRLVG